MSEMQEVPKLRLTDDGLETPEHLVGHTGQVTVAKPHITMEMQFTGNGVKEVSDNLLTFPPTDVEAVNCPEGHVRISGTLYEIVDDRDLNECPHCGSDKIAAHDEPPKCYGCETNLTADTGTTSDDLGDGGSE